MLYQIVDRVLLVNVKVAVALNVHITLTPAVLFNRVFAFSVADPTVYVHLNARVVTTKFSKLYSYIIMRTILRTNVSRIIFFMMMVFSNS